jgi:hypothetical protein
MTWIGIFLLATATASAIVAVTLFVSLLPLGVLTPDGEPGSDVLMTSEAPSAGGGLELEAGREYALYLVRPVDAVDGELSGPVVVTAPDGTVFSADRSPAVDVSSSGGGIFAESFAAFRATDPGMYLFDVPTATDDVTTSVFLVEDRETFSFIGGVFGSVGGVFATLLLGAPGLALTIGGALWWRSRRRTRRAAVAGRPA